MTGNRIAFGTNMAEFMEGPQIIPKKRMKTSSIKAKSRSLQNKVTAKLIAAFPQLGEGDVRPVPMSSAGEDVQLSPAARLVIPHNIECKKYQKFAIYAHYDQAGRHGGHEPLVVIEADRRKPLAVVDLDYFIRLLQIKSASGA